MNIRILSFFLLAAASPFLAIPAGAQTLLVPTTLSSAVTTSSAKTFVVTSATGFAAGGFAYVEKELAEIEAVSGTTITVRRGASGTGAAPHESGAYVFPLTTGQAFANTPTGSCTRANIPVLPAIDYKAGVISDCLGGRWVPSDTNSGAQTSVRFRILNAESGGTAYTSLNTSGTTLGATTLYCSEVFLPEPKLLTGIALLNGTTVGTDKHYVVLYDSAGNALANSALAGATTSGASTFQARAFTTQYFAVGPAQYFGCFQSNGTTDTVRMLVTGISADNVLTKGQTGATFGTVPALTVPTTFTTAVGPYLYLY